MSATPRVAMILAAGRGERMRPLTDSLPKPLLRIGGKPLIEYHVQGLARAGIDRLVINLAWLGERIRDHLGDGSRFGVAITYSEETPAALETAGGIFRALKWLTPEPFLVVNGDIFTDIAFWRLRMPPGSDAHLVFVPNPAQHPQGDFGLRDGHARPRSADEPSYTFAGVGLYRAHLFEGCTDGAFPLKPLLLRAMERNACTAELHTGLWEDVGTPQRLAQLDERLFGARKAGDV
ncbi:MAG: nucleotidyltransferase family protein [Steroidobacteraceae bacterium]